MMIFDEFQDLVSQAGSRYGLVIAVTKRAREIRSGEDALVNYHCDKTVSLATQEMIEGKIKIVKAEEKPEEPVSDFQLLDSIG
ncbi:MAG: DNA-directed RNA polymerase subunit omega [Clostridia bacterium]|nr:DNA-directed RNA polymerase subunit omega [Clostridia bacterium]